VHITTIKRFSSRNSSRRIELFSRDPRDQLSHGNAQQRCAAPYAPAEAHQCAQHACRSWQPTPLRDICPTGNHVLSAISPIHKLACLHHSRLRQHLSNELLPSLGITLAHICSWSKLMIRSFLHRQLVKQNPRYNDGQYAARKYCPIDTLKCNSQVDACKTTICVSKLAQITKTGNLARTINLHSTTKDTQATDFIILFSNLTSMCGLCGRK